MNFLIGIVAVRPSYRKRTIQLIEQLAPLNVNFIVLTDKIEDFAFSNRIKTIKYDKPIF